MEIVAGVLRVMRLMPAIISVSQVVNCGRKPACARSFDRNRQCRVDSGSSIVGLLVKSISGLLKVRKRWSLRAPLKLRQSELETFIRSRSVRPERVAEWLYVDVTEDCWIAISRVVVPVH
jgi:hypothetical protein